MVTERTNNSGFFLLVLMVGAVLFLLMPLSSITFSTELIESAPAIKQEADVVIGCKPLAKHAAKHPESVEIWQWLNTNDASYCRWDCDDGKTRYACFIGGKLAMAVEDATAIITAFFTSQEYVHANVIDNPRCRPYMNRAHP